MIRKSITIEDALTVLNRAFEADPLAMDALRSAKVPCNDKLGSDPEIQVGYIDRKIPSEKRCYAVGFLGIINGLFGIDDETKYGAIGMDYDVRCPGGCVFDEGTELAVGDKCPSCEKQLVFGDMLGFSEINHEKIKERIKEKSESNLIDSLLKNEGGTGRV